MSRLDEAVDKSVAAGPSPADDETQDAATDLDLDADAAGDADDGEDEQGKKNERTAENVRGELLRKMEKSNDAMLAELRAIREDNAALKAQYGVPAQTASAQPKTLDDMSIQELETMKPNVPDEQKVAFNEYLSDRKVDERVSSSLDKFQTKAEFKREAEKYDGMAMDRWPDLRNKSSEFYGIADRIMSEMGSRANNDPRSVLAAANEAGLQLGLTPATSVRRTREPGQVAPGRSTKGTKAAGDDAVADPAIAERLQNAMPGRKFSREQLKRIAKRDKLYKDDISNRVRG